MIAGTCLSETTTSAESETPPQGETPPGTTSRWTFGYSTNPDIQRILKFETSTRIPVWKLLRGCKCYTTTLRWRNGPGGLSLISVLQWEMILLIVHILCFNKCM